MYDALVLTKHNARVKAAVESLADDRLPKGDTVVRVEYSSLNYKDALAVTGEGRVIRGEYPFVPGIDLAGAIIETTSPHFEAGDRVIGTGWGLGETHWGGYAQRMRLQADWLVPLPDGMSALRAMSLGTAGLTAMLAVIALESHQISPDSGDVVVTGATGGVGSLSILLLSSMGYTVVAATGKTDAEDYLNRLGATRIVERNEFSRGPESPLDTGQWTGAIDSVGGATLATLISQTRTHGAIAACGLAGGASLETTVYPFILRGVQLLGIDSNTCPVERRLTAWSRLHDVVDDRLLQDITTVIPLSDVPSRSKTVLAGRHLGRTVVDLNANAETA